MGDRSGDDPVLRPAGPCDAAACAAVHVRGWQATYAALAPGVADLRPADREPRWRELLAGRAPGSTLVLEAAGDVVGLVGVLEDACELALLYLDPAAHGRGWGVRLHDAGLDLLRAAGCREARLWVLEGNGRARRFYAERGWTPTEGRQQVDVAGTLLTEVRLRRDLSDGAAPDRHLAGSAG